jgi:TonB family protein
MHISLFRVVWLTVAAALASAAGWGVAGAQAAGVKVSGTVVSESGERVVGAQVGLMRSASRGTSTDDDGTFELFVLGDSTPRLLLKRIGFRPETVVVRVVAGEAAPLRITLARTIQMVRAVVVNAPAGSSDPWLAAVRDRERTGGNGHFVYRDEFMKSNPARFTDVLRRMPGIRINRNSRNATEIRLRNNRCGPLYWLDGQPLVGVPFDPDVLPPQTVEAIEVYSSPSLVPAQFQGPQYAQGCGAIVIWTRQGERPVRKPKINADSIARLLDAHRVFVAAEVDQPARIVSIQQPEYPDSLRAAGVGGSAVVEFIITADGKVDRESIGVVSATHIKFGEAVRVALLEATFFAAMRAGKPVAQLFQFPVTFTAPPKP